MLLTNAGGMLGAAIAPGALCAEAGGPPLETGRKLNSSARLVAMEMNACHLAAAWPPQECSIRRWGKRAAGLIGTTVILPVR